MSDAIDGIIYLFRKWMTLVFTDMSFQISSYNVSFGWLIVAATVISMIIASILNIPSRLPQNAFYSRSGRIDRDERRAIYRRNIRNSVRNR